MRVFAGSLAAFTVFVFLSAVTSLSASAQTPGDINQDDEIDLSDAVMAMQILANVKPSPAVSVQADVDQDGRIGLEEPVFILQWISELRKPNQTPTSSFIATMPTTGDAPLEVSLDASGSEDADGTIVSYSWSFGDGAADTGETVSHIYTDPGTYMLVLTVTDNAGGIGTASEWIIVTGQTEPPADPADAAPEVDQTVTTTLAAATEFLYQGSNCTQNGMDPRIIEEERVAVLRGKVSERDGTALSGVIMTVLNHPEYGQTMTRDDGMFDLVVNGGGLVTVNYEKNGYLPAQRKVNVPLQNYVWLPDVVLIPIDSVVTEIDLTSPDPFQVAQASVVTDGDGTRQATVLFPQGVSAELVMPDGSTQPISTLNVRATEYSVGENGPNAMPAELPTNSGYTYCVELSADEAMAAGAADVRFDQPVYFYVEDFIGFPVGGAVPTGYYDRKKAQWLPSDNGRVIKVVGVSAGLANLDTDGDDLADDPTTLAALGITHAERQELAGLYGPGQGLWRVPVAHFTPWDHNWPFGPPLDAQTHDGSQPHGDNPTDKPCEGEGSIIECQNQTLGESIPVV